MRKLFFPLAIWLILASNARSQTNSASPKIDPASRQMILVTTESWEQVTGSLQRFERSSNEFGWKAVGESIPVVVGRSGLAWGRGLHPATKDEPQKIEGDGKSPAGIFRLSSAFGLASPAETGNFKMPYLQLTEMIECVDDIQSVRYNTITDRSHILGPDWKSSEKMRAVGEQYRLGIVVDHNSARVTGKGSCIFLHIWKGDGSGTSGCTAMAGVDIEKIMGWLDAAAKPILVQLPIGEFQRLRGEWKLPALTDAPQ